MKKGILLFVYKNNRSMNLLYLENIFKEDILINIGTHILLDLEKCKLDEIFKKIKNLNVGQAIVSSSSYRKLINHCLRNSLYIDKINFFDELKDVHTEYINELLFEIKRDISPRLRSVLVSALSEEIKYIQYEEENDISSIIINTPKGNTIKFEGANRIYFEEEDMDLVGNILLIFQE